MGKNKLELVGKNVKKSKGDKGKTPEGQDEEKNKDDE